eukprot:1149388-Rhodomonas_salina.1
MSKQSIGIPFYTFWRKNDSKSYFLLTPQVPICRNKVIQDGLQFDAFPNGINAVVSVLTYTGFDMEDALIVNRDSITRGVDKLSPTLDKDGFPLAETHIDTLVKSSLKLRHRRKPSPGDKFASRHGQKGVLSYDFSSLDLPFSETGITPDIIFNPHGFPSRMTIGVILESIAGKSGAFKGTFQDSSPFRFFHDRTSAYHFGEKLRQSGFQFFGGEVLYSGYTGEPFKMDIFVGLINIKSQKLALEIFLPDNQQREGKWVEQYDSVKWSETLYLDTVVSSSYTIDFKHLATSIAL